jgi:hypothetical protein
MVPEQGAIPYSPIYDQPTHSMQQTAQDVEHIWKGFEMTSTEQLPVWLSDQTLGGQTIQQYGMDAFLLPSDYLPTAAQIW